MAGPSSSAIPESEAGGRLTIDLGALRANWRDLARRAGPAECAAVVKADAYGIGIEAAVPALAGAGCRTFFVALPWEARRVRAVAPGATIYVLGGLTEGAEPALHDCNLRPVLGSLPEIGRWAAFCRDVGTALPAAIHIDTGMNRLGLSEDEIAAIAGQRDMLGAFRISLVMSHLACADTPDHPLNGEQLSRFDALRARLPEAPASLANSGATLLGAPFLFDLVRPGIALYGGRAVNGRTNPMRQVAGAEARVIQIRSARAGDRVGYGAAQSLNRDSRLAILSAGYADGYMRSAGASDERTGATVYFGRHPAPLVGRVSMDLIAADVTDIPDDQVFPGCYAEILGNRFTVDDLADSAGTIGYEILTGLGRRFHRVYVDRAA
jgi:alanine racemase